MVIVRLSGGMGNQMFQYALGRRLSLDHGVPLKLDTTFLLHRVSLPQSLRPHFVFRNYDLDVFKVAATIATANEMKWWQRPISSGKLMLAIDAMLRKTHFLSGWEKSFSYDERVLELGPNAYLSGFWQSPKYFESIRETLLQDFTLVHSLSQASQVLMEEIKEKNSLCIHVRRSDIASKSFHGAVDTVYYDKTVAYISEHTSIEKIYVFSDDIAWCKAYLHFPIETMFVDEEYSGKKGEEHLVLMIACKHFIIPNSTFSWWAAWLSRNENKIVVVPKKWFNNDINTDDLIPAAWIRL